MLTNRVIEYLQTVENHSDYPSVKDRTGRFLLPLDTVVYGGFTDQGIQVLVQGVVAKVNPTQNEVLVEPEETPKLMGFESQIVDGGNLFRMLTGDINFWIELLEYFSWMNQHVLLEAGPLTLKGRLLT